MQTLTLSMQIHPEVTFNYWLQDWHVDNAHTHTHTSWYVQVRYSQPRGTASFNYTPRVTFAWHTERVDANNYERMAGNGWAIIQVRVRQKPNQTNAHYYCIWYMHMDKCAEFVLLLLFSRLIIVYPQ